MEKLQLIYGTGNPAKLDAMRRRLDSLPLEILGLQDACKTLSDQEREELKRITEDGRTPLENAQKKARGYFQVLKRPIFSCDSGLYFENVPERLQPGIHVRTINGEYCSDAQMEEYYTGLAKKYGNLRAEYRNAICLIMGPGREYSLMDESIASKPFLITSVPHERACRPGFPLDRISLDIRSGRYYYDLEDSALDQVAVEDGFLRFFERVLSVSTSPHPE